MAGGALALPQNPGIGGLNELTSPEELFVQNLAGLSYAQGDILYHNGTSLTRLAAGTSGHFLKTNGAGANPEWAAGSTGATTALDNLASVAINAALLPGTSDSIALGSATKMWSDLFLGDGAVLNYNNGNVAVTHSSGILTMGTGELRITTPGTNAASVPTLGSTSTLTNKTLTSPVINTGTIGTSLVPTSDDGAALGDTTHNFSDLFLATGAVLNYANGNVAVTHSSGILTMGTGELRITTPGTNAASVPTLGSTSTLTNKTLTSPVINTGTIGTSLVPTSDDGAALGDTTHNFSDLFLATGSVINYANGNVAITHSSGILTMGTGEMRITTPGTNAASVVTAGGTQELDNKTLDSSVGKGTWTTSGTWTLPAMTFGGDITLAENVGIYYDAALSADGKYSGFCRAGTAGATLAFGDLVYLAAADSRWELADADAASTSGDVLIAMCVLAAASDGDPTVLLLQGFIRADAAFPALTISAPAYVGTTAGDIQTAQPSGTDDVIRRVGFAWTADELYFNPSNDYVTHT